MSPEIGADRLEVKRRFSADLGKKESQGKWSEAATYRWFAAHIDF